MALFSKFAVVLVRNTFRELSRLRHVIEVGVDTYRQTHGLPPAFDLQSAEPSPTFSKDPTHTIQPGDFLTVWMIEELCREQRVPFDNATDLEQVAKDMGWITPEGKFLMVPASALQTMSGEDIRVVMGQA